MTILRATKKVLRYLPSPHEVDAESTGALGDWFVNRTVVDKQPLLILVSSTSLLPIVTRARSVSTLPDRLSQMVFMRLAILGISGAVIEQEIAAMNPVVVCRTNSKRTVGTVVEFARMLPYYLPVVIKGDGELLAVSLELGEMPSQLATGGIIPNEEARTLLLRRWGGA